MQVELSDIALELRHPVMTSRGIITQRDGIRVAVTGDGCTGWGEAMPLPGWPGADLPAARRALAAWAADPDPQNLPPERFARAAVELALLDWEARRRGCTQAEVLAAGGAVAESVGLNALVRDPKEAAAAVAAGFDTVKLKVGTACVEDDLAMVGAVREATGGAARLRLDANGAWTMTQAVAVLARLEQYGIEYVEEPVAGLTALSRVAERSPVPVAADESLGFAGIPVAADESLGFAGIPVAADESLGFAATSVPESIPVLVIKPMALGGPRTAHAAACRWIQQGRKVVITNYLDSAIGQHAALSVAAALPGPRQVHGTITPALFTRDTTDLPAVTTGHVFLMC
ncbi:mandelate racemase/muconate lactonizing enzyme family protein [Candidatus Poriferisocius sp.]|uniref:mandelate racemase/muconate lactonizing enzyme family protein n=1 Tax=Candidatus Poriferisocius sp. TaxID=3101276 RepID=UPI003B01583B